MYNYFENTWENKASMRVGAGMLGGGDKMMVRGKNKVYTSKEM